MSATPLALAEWVVPLLAGVVGVVASLAAATTAVKQKARLKEELEVHRAMIAEEEKRVPEEIGKIVDQLAAERNRETILRAEAVKKAADELLQTIEKLKQENTRLQDELQRRS